jgi:prepilin-type N-terminal cleavage/methylation domain-containing protein
MECNATFTKRARAEAAFTLVELLVAIAISGILLATLAQVIFYTGRSFAALMNYTELDRYSRNALDQMVYKIRQADELKSFSSNRLMFSYLKTNELVYEYSPTDRTLSEIFEGHTKTILRGCDHLNFSIYQRNTAAGTFDQFPATITNSAAKLVQMNWTCSRNVLGARINTESVQSAKIVLRNQ